MLRSVLSRLNTLNTNVFLKPPMFSSLVNPASLAQQNLDKLYETIIVEVRGHDRAVLNSYEFFAKTAASELDVHIARIWEPQVHKARRTLLKSIFIYKKHRVQYEFRTYFRLFELKHITGSTADTYLEYIQRNLPEGVGMKVTKTRLEKFPEHIANYIPEKKIAGFDDSRKNA
ncbi:putative 28S ribosomal protein S10, mitochondrial [Araneus ventricosus]|uniref:Small ribosomal subunit protein uS10m n=1 Tax=Araneus ventricosus TaxID=182803 RepID=A0A4Y2AML0_ARAVE|nr:putative 28S ribosomal protein S10, mitochondrial [Araneus ventricosus]